MKSIPLLSRRIVLAAVLVFVMSGPLQGQSRLNPADESNSSSPARVAALSWSSELTPWPFKKLDDGLETITPGNWHNATDYAHYILPEGGGYVFGTNRYNDLVKAQQFWLEEEIALAGVIVWFFHVEYGGGSLDFKIWDMSNDVPGEVIVSKTVSLSEINESENFENAFYLEFDEAVYLSGNYLVGFDMQDAQGSEIGLVSSVDGDGGLLGLAMEQWNNSVWYTVLQSWGLDVDLAIFPVKYTGEVPTSAGDDMQVSPGLNVFPNPASGVLNIQSVLVMDEVRILDMLGKPVFSAPGGNKRLRVDTNGFWPGIYFVQVLTAQGVVTKRIQVVR